MEPLIITDPDDPRLDDYRGLRRPDRTSAARGVCVVEGVTVVERVLRSPLAPSVQSVVVTPERLARVRELTAQAGVLVLVAMREVLAEVAGFDVHRGVLASMLRPSPVALDDLGARATTLVALEGSNDQENLGAIARSARALGADGLVLDPTCADPYSRRVIRVSMGEILELPVARATPWPAALDTLGQHGVRVLALTPSGTTSLHDLTLAAGQRVTVLAGAEAPGLSAGALARCADTVRIPMRPGVDSLNVGHAVAITLSHLMRLREAH